jgi:hypothetical protein
MAHEANTNEAWRTRVLGGLRVLGALTVMGSIVGMFSAHAVYANVAEQTFRGGLTLEGLSDLLADGHRIHLNGEVLNVGNVMVDESVGQVLDRTQSHCEAGESGGIGPSFEGLREQDGTDAGMVLCFAKDGVGPRLPFIDRVAKFVESRDLRDVGPLRYTVARKAASGQTHVLTFWSNDSLRLDRILPREGDAPGRDGEGVPRPEGALRILEAGVEGTSFTIRTYEVAKTPEEALESYHGTLQGVGWLSNGAAAEAIGTGRAYSRGDEDILVTVAAQGKGSVVTTVHMHAK